MAITLAAGASTQEGSIHICLYKSQCHLSPTLLSSSAAVGPRRLVGWSILLLQRLGGLVWFAFGIVGGLGGTGLFPSGQII